MKRKHYLHTLLLVVCLMTSAINAEPPLGHLKTFNHFDIWYTNDFGNKPLHAVKHDAVDRFAPVLEAVRNVELNQINFDNPRMRQVKIFDQIGINAKGGYWGMKFDPYFLEEPDPKSGKTATIQERYAIALHEYFHVIQYHYFYKSWEARKWIIEGNARLLQDKLDFPGVDIDNATEHYASYWSEVNGYLSKPNQNLFKSSYSAALFWNYVCEQFGSIRTEPEMGVDAIQQFWEAADDIGNWRNELKVFNRMLTYLGYTQTTFEDVLADFFAANFLKDHPNSPGPMYYYLDEKHPGAEKYREVRIRLNETMDVTDSLVKTDYVVPYGARYYNFRFEADQGTQSSTYPVQIRVNQVSRNDMIYQLITTDGKTGEVEVKQIFSKDLDITKAVTPGTEIMLIVSSLAASDSDPAQYHYAINGQGNPTIDILSPKGVWNFHRARAGKYDDPEKILVTLHALNQDLKVIRGIDPDDFHVAIGGKMADITVVHEQFGVYFLEVLPPKQTIDGIYDLEVSYSTASATELNAVRYGDINADIVTVIDASGSMDSDNKIDAAKVASQVYLSSARDTDQFGIVFFDEDAKYFSSGLFPVDKYRSELYYNLSSLHTYKGGTSVGDGMDLANTWLWRGNSLHEKFMIVLSDGKENKPKYIHEVDDLLWGNGTRLYAVVLGEDTDADKLEYAANTSGGMLLYGLDNTTGYTSSLSARLLLESLNSGVDSSGSYDTYPITSLMSNYYRKIAEESTREERIFSYSDVLDGSWTIDKTINISQADYASIILSYRTDSAIGGDAPLSIIDPNADVIYPTHQYDQIGANGDIFGHMLWRIDNPVEGAYSFTANGNGEIEYFLEAAVKSPVTQNTYFPLPGYIPAEERDYRVTGCEFPIVATLSGYDPITDAEVYATVSTGSIDNYQTWQLKLYDDGNHGDGEMGDGVYANNFTRTSRAGLYQVEIKGSGSYQGYDFTRENLEAFFLSEDYDLDGDGLPHYWEIRHGLDDTDSTAEFGAEGDPDGDGLANIKELAIGTYPRLVDTDAGGEQDRSEYLNSRDPWFEEDDILTSPLIYGIPSQNGMISVFYSNHSSYNSLDLYRTDDLNTPFSLVATDLQPETSHYNDTNLTHGTTYYYKMLAHGNENSGEITGWSNIASVDLLLHVDGFVVVNKGEDQTNSRTVELILYGDSSVTHYRASLDASFEGTSWKTFTDTVTFTLGSTEGVYSVYVQYKDSTGNIGGHDAGLYGFDAIRLNYSYIPEEDEEITSTDVTSISTETLTRTNDASKPPESTENSILFTRWLPVSLLAIGTIQYFREKRRKYLTK